MTESLKKLLAAALNRRDGLVSSGAGDTDSVRLLHSEADGFRGITVDRLGKTLLVEAHRRDVGIDVLVDLLVEHFGPDTPIFFKERWSKDSDVRTGRQIRGPDCSPEFAVLENGLRFLVNLLKDEHIGLFLDSRPARTLVRETAADKRVLNLFSYTGAFGVTAQAGGARSTTNIDNKRSALATAKMNYELNQLPFDTRTFLRSDAFKYVTRAAKSKGRFDLIILDPPPASKRPGNKWFNAKTGYVPIVSKCLSLLAPNGQVLAGLNAKDISDPEFDRMLRDASAQKSRQIKIVDRIGPGADFPFSCDRPVARFVLFGLD